jgi:hypothetical protein
VVAVGEVGFGVQPRGEMSDDGGVAAEVEMSGWMRWFTVSGGERAEPHSGGRYAATASAVSRPADDLWSIAFDDVVGADKSSGLVTRHVGTRGGFRRVGLVDEPSDV